MGTGGHCFIATAAFESELAPEIIYLSDYRDKVLMKSSAGRAFIKFYYKIGPYFADIIYKSATLRSWTRSLLRPLIKYAKKRLRN